MIITKNKLPPFLPLLWRGRKSEVKTTFMKKLLTYLILITCFQTFISASPSSYFTKNKVSHTAKTNQKNEDLQHDDINYEIHPLNILGFRIN